MDSSCAGDNAAQVDKFKAAARELGADEDEARWDDRLRKVAKPKTAAAVKPAKT